MKRIYAVGISILFSGAVLAQTDKSELPQRSVDFIDEHVSSERIADIDVDDNWYNMSDSETYEVEFDNGTEIDFNRKGEITEIEAEDRASIPLTVFPESVRSKLEREYPDAEVVTWEKEKEGHEIELRDGTELWFDSSEEMKRDHNKMKKKDQKNKY